MALAAAVALVVFDPWHLFRPGPAPSPVPEPPVAEQQTPPQETPPDTTPLHALLTNLGTASAAQQSGTAALNAMLQPARIEDVQGDVLVQTGTVAATAFNGQGLPPGSEVFAYGEDAQAVVRFADGTRLEVGPGSRVRLEMGPIRSGGIGKRVVLLEGTLGADVRKQPSGLPLILRTPHAEVTVRGTRFSSISNSAATRVELQEGQIALKRVAPEGSAEEVILEKGDYAVVSAQTRKIAQNRMPARRTDNRSVLPGSGGAVLTAAFVSNGLLVCLNQDGFASLWDAANGMEVRRFERPPLHFTALTVSADGKTLALGGADRQARTGWVVLYETTTGRELGAWRGPREVLALAFSPDGRTLAVGGPPTRRPGDASLWTLTDGVLTPWNGQTEAVQALAFAADGRTLAAGGRDGVVRLYNPATHEERMSLHASSGPVLALAYSADGAWLASGGRDGVVRVWETATNRETALLFNPRGAVTALAFTPDARYLLTASKPGFATLWDRAAGRELTSFQGHKAGVVGLAVSPDGQTLATASADRSVRLWLLLPPPRWWQPA
jgi:WD40 repeat protein